MITCKEYREKILSKVKTDIENHEFDFIPTVVIISVGNDYASSVYMRNKVKTCESVGIGAKVVSLPEESDYEEIRKTINEYAFLPEAVGIMVQLPLPKHLNEKDVLALIPYYLDVDCLTDKAYGRFMHGHSEIGPCTPLGIISYLKEITELKGKRAVVIGRSYIVGRPMAELLTKEDCTVTLCHSKTKDIGAYTKEADIIVCAVGKKDFLSIGMVKEGAIVVDVGINRNEEGKVCGDVMKNVSDIAYVTPVPGGVGVLTTAMLCKNISKNL